MTSHSDIRYCDKQTFSAALDKLAACFPASRAVTNQDGRVRLPDGIASEWWPDFECYPFECIKAGMQAAKRGRDFPTMKDLRDVCKPSACGLGEKYVFDNEFRKYVLRVVEQKPDMQKPDILTADQLDGVDRYQWIRDEIEKWRARGNSFQVARWEKCLSEVHYFQNIRQTMKLRDGNRRLGRLVKVAGGVL